MCKTNILYVDKSKIEGNGLFSKINLNKNTCIGLLAVVYGDDEFDDKPYGNFINHSKNNNITLELVVDKKKEIIYVIGKTNKYINKGEELTANYYDKNAPKPNYKTNESFEFDKKLNIF